MKTVTVTAIADFMWRGNAVEKDDAIEMAPVDAAVYAQCGKVSLSKRPAKPKVRRPVVQTVALTPEPSSPDPDLLDESRSKRRYQRRDLEPKVE
jgi:hypothetical protein